MNIVLKAEQFVFELFKDKVSDAYIYHNFQHTSRVFYAVKVLVENLGISESDAEVLYLAAWFHDTGYSVSEHDHALKGGEVAREFLAQENYPEDKIKEVVRLIKATFSVRSKNQWST